MNGISVIKKCLEALSKESPDLSYIRGMLETFVEMNVVEVNAPVTYVSNDPPNQVLGTRTKTADDLLQVHPLSDEASFQDSAILKSYSNGPIARTS